LDINHEKQFRFNNNLQFELLEKGKVVLTANSRGLFYLEYFREKPEDLTSEFEAAKSVDEESSSSSCLEEPQKEENITSKTIDFTHAWVEHFEGVTEELEHGPQSVGMDFTFNAANVYGIPMHASDLSLKTTSGEDADYQEPFRLYNLDAFEFQLNEPMSLYGSVPMMMGQSQNHTAGLYWHNCSETWIDTKKPCSRNKPRSNTDTLVLGNWFVRCLLFIRTSSKRYFSTIYIDSWDTSTADKFLLSLPSVSLELS